MQRNGTSTSLLRYEVMLEMYAANPTSISPPQPLSEKKKEIIDICDMKQCGDRVLKGMSVIAIPRKNSLFCCTHHSTNNAALIYSLACSCKLNGLNSFDYFTDLLNKLANVNPKTEKEYLRNLLPDRWRKEK